MQTFLTYECFTESAIILDWQRHNKQRSEANDIIGILTNFADTSHSTKQQAYLVKRYSNHPAVRMWSDNVDALKVYFNVFIYEWVQAGYENNYSYFKTPMFVDMPEWLGDPRLHYSHRANLVRKDPDFYGFFWPDVDPAAPYWWPVKLLDDSRQRVIDNYYKGW